MSRSSSDRIKPQVSSRCPSAGSSNAPSLGSAAADDWPRTGNASTTRRSPSCASPPSASCYRDVDFVHVNTPITDHGWMSIAALKAGKHVMCTVPMALSIDECRQIVELVARTGLRYMMAETVLYSREYLFARELARSGRLGKIQYLQGSHHQDMDGWPGGWPGLPPMYYATHCIAPCLAIVDGEAETVSCFGSGRIRDELAARYGSPF